MVPTAKCPSCGKLVTQVHFEVVPAVPGFFTQESWRSLAYLCPQCRTVLSVQIDPISLRSAIEDRVSREVSTLRGHVERLEQMLTQLAQSRR